LIVVRRSEEAEEDTLSTLLGSRGTGGSYSWCRVIPKALPSRVVGDSEFAFVRLRREEVPRLDLLILLAVLVASSAFAQNKPPEGGPIVLPAPEPPFKGVIGETYKDSKPDKIPIVKAPEGAPNVLVVLIDDCGFGQWSTFGGQIPTPNLDRLAKSGLRYIRFHTTALCSPTRAALLTGRNAPHAGTDS